jgi:hypothetical protein
MHKTMIREEWKEQGTVRQSRTEWLSRLFTKRIDMDLTMRTRSRKTFGGAHALEGYSFLGVARWTQNAAAFTNILLWPFTP